MPWVKLDDGFDGHPKVLKAGNEAIGLHVRALAHSNAYLTDGKVSRNWANERAGKRTERLAERLVDAGLWDLNGDGWVIHDYLQFQKSRAQILADRSKDSRRKRGGRHD